MTEPVPLARIHHRMRGRVRIRLAEPVSDADAFETLAHSLGTMPGVARVAASTTTGSITIHHSGAFEPIGEAIAAAGLLRIEPAEPTPLIDPVAAARTGLAEADDALGRITGGRVDLVGLAFAALIAGGILQIARGRIAGPAINLFAQAATIAAMRTSSTPR